MKIIVGFSRPRKWKIFAQAIMWWDKSDASHGYIRFRSERWDNNFIYQSSHSQTNFVGGEYFQKINKVVEEFEIEVEESIESRIGNLCVDREGKPYAIKQVIGIAMMNIMFVISFGKVRIKNPFSDGDEETDCIEEVAAILKEALGIEAPFDMDSVSVKPFRDWVRSLPQAKKLV
jgi:hypothetical protein